MNIIHVYNFVNANGTKLQLNLGVLKEKESLPKGDAGLRWSFVGTKIPMPVRAHTWFNGFPEPVMLEWLKANGWHLHTDVNPRTLNVKVHELPKAPEASEENRCKYIVVVGDGVKDPIWPGINFDNARRIRDDINNRGGHAEVYRRVDCVDVRVMDPGKYIVDDGDGYVAMFNNFHEANEEYQGLLIAGYPNPRFYELKDYVEPAKATDWIPVGSGKYPEDGEVVQITYRDWLNKRNPLCNLMAFRRNGYWYWAEHGDIIRTEITAWKPIGEPYREEESK